jgi:hypothetical protein
MDQSTAPSPPTAAAAPDDDVCTDFALNLLEMTFDTMRTRANEDPARLAARRAAVATALDSLQAHDPIGQMFAAHAVASHHATMECFRRAMLAVNDPDAATRLHRSATALSRMMADTVKDLSGRQGQASGGKTP